MQTFLPYPDFAASAKVLDFRRLGKQRVEAYQIYRTLTHQSAGWITHPATRMWRNHVDALGLYMNTMIIEWSNRGYKNTMSLVDVCSNFSYPRWFGRLDFHASHRSNLLRKNPTWYGRFGWNESPDLPYIWPV